MAIPPRALNSNAAFLAFAQSSDPALAARITKWRPARREGNITRLRRQALIALQNDRETPHGETWHRFLYDDLAMGAQLDILNYARQQSHFRDIEMVFLLSRKNAYGEDETWFSRVQKVRGGSFTPALYRSMVEHYEEGDMHIVGMDWRFV